MRFSIHSRNEAPFLALFDVGATSIGASISVFENGHTNVLWNLRLDYSYIPDEDYPHYERSMFATLLDIGMRLTTDGVREARNSREDFTPARMRVACVLAPPWFLGTVTSASKTWNSLTRASAGVYEALLEETRQKAFDTEEATSWQTVVGDAEVLEQIAQKKLLNGYLVESFVDQEAVQANVVSYVALIAKDIRAHIEEILERVLPNHSIHLTTSTNVLVQLHRLTMGSGTGNHGYLVEVGGHVTSIATIQGGVLSIVSTIPLGTHDILAVTAPHATTAEEARGKLFLLHKSAVKNSQALPANVEQEVTAWFESVCGAFNMHSNGTIPLESVFLMAPKEWAELLTLVLTRARTMPGIKEQHRHIVTPVALLVETIETPGSETHKSTKSSDIRLTVFSHSLFYTHPA